jgi:hypothetical protein
VEESSGIRHVFEDVPERERVKAALKMCGVQRRALHIPFSLKRFSSLFAQVFIWLDAGNLPTGPQSLGQEKTRGAANVQYAPSPYVAVDNPQMPSSCAIAALQLGLVDPRVHLSVQLAKLFRRRAHLAESEPTGAAAENAARRDLLAGGTDRKRAKGVVFFVKVYFG